jgi:hypothetical protein
MIFESAWKQIKLVNALHHIESKEILSIVEMAENVNRTKLVLLNLVMFIMITIFCQGG